MNQKQQFADFLEELFPNEWKQILPSFEQFHAELVKVNSMINLYSRRMDPDDIWTVHFLDSLLLLKCMKLESEKVLDFGSGGGLPGIPLLLVKPLLDMILLDAKGKKVKALQDIIQALGLQRCHTAWSRIEDYQPASKFDVIVCRSVRITPAFRDPLLRMLQPNGRIYLYKSRAWEDAELFSSFRVHDVSHLAVGTRNIIEIGKL